MKKLYLLTAVGQDRPGIISQVTGILFKSKVNLQDISMTILENQFAMIMALCLEARLKSKVEKTLEGFGLLWELSFFWKELKPHTGSTSASKSKPAVSHLISAIGPDRTGIVYEISRILAKHKLNITDLNSRILGKNKKQTLYALALEVDIPAIFSLKRLEKSFAVLSRKLGIDITLKPVERIEF